MNILGHQNKLEQLKRAAASNQLANAYIFTGSEGIGKHMVALHFASELLGNDERVINGTHPDAINISLLDGKKDISIEQMREMQSRVQLHAMEGKFKIVIIDNAERMNTAAQNSILKTLEEPPAFTHFFLITSRFEMLLPTIVSRCQKISFSPLPFKEIVPIIKDRLRCDGETATLLADIAHGSLGLALTLPVETVKNVVVSIKKIWSASTPAKTLAIAENFGKEEDPSTVLTILTAIYNDIARCKMLKRPPVFKDLSSEITSMSQNMPIHIIQNKLSLLIAAQNDAQATYNKQLMFEELLFTLSPQ